MNCIYQATAKNTYEEYQRFSNVLFWNKKSIIIDILLSLFLILDGILLHNIFFILFAVLFPLLLIFLHKRRIKKVFDSNKALQNAEMHYEFYDSYFTQTNAFGSTKLEYTQLYKIIETKTNFYLMIAKNQGFLLTKETLPKGLAEFLQIVKP